MKLVHGHIERAIEVGLAFRCGALEGIDVDDQPQSRARFGCYEAANIGRDVVFRLVSSQTSPGIRVGSCSRKRDEGGCSRAAHISDDGRSLGRRVERYCRVRKKIVVLDGRAPKLPIKEKLLSLDWL